MQTQSGVAALQPGASSQQGQVLQLIRKMQIDVLLMVVEVEEFWRSGLTTPDLKKISQLSIRVCHSQHLKKIEFTRPDSHSTYNLSRRFFFGFLSKMIFWWVELALKFGLLAIG